MKNGCQSGDFPITKVAYIHLYMQIIMIWILCTCYSQVEVDLGLD